jgi:predicted MFS family arabinose efflux permease
VPDTGKPIYSLARLRDDLFGLRCLACLRRSDSLAILLAGRVLMNLGESLLITASMAWSIGLLGPQHSGQVIAWSAIAMYGAMAIGAPVGVLIEGAFGFASVSLAAELAPLTATPFILPLSPVQPSARPRLPFLKVVRMVWLPGMGVTLATFGFALLIAFVIGAPSGKGLVSQPDPIGKRQ